MKKAVVFAFLAVVFVQSLAAQTASDASNAFQLGRLDKALLIYRDLTKADPSNIENWLNLGNLHLANGGLDKALESFTKAATTKPDDALAYVANARIALLNGNSEESVKMINKARKAAKGKNSTLLRLAAESYYFGKTRNIPRAIEILQEANEANTKDIQTLMALGWAWKEVPDGGKSLTNYEFASDLDKSNPVPVYRIGQVYMQSRNGAKYEEYMKKTLAMAPNFVPAARGLGDYYYNLDKIKQSREVYEKFINTSEATIEDRMQYANVLFFMKDYEQLIPYVEDVIKSDGSRNYLRRLLGYAAFETGDFDKGLSIMNDYFTRVTPEKIIANDYEYLAKLLEKKGQDSLAYENYLLAINKEPAKKWSLYKPAGKLAMYKLKRNDEAVKFLQINLDSLRLAQAAGNDGPRSEDFFFLAIAYERVKNYTQADTLYANVCQMSPSALTGWRARAKLNSNYLEPTVSETDTTSTAKFGVAKKYYDKVIELALADKVKNSKDLKDGYTYLCYYFLVKDDQVQSMDYARKVLEIDPTDARHKDLLAQLEAANAAPATDPKKNK